MEQTGIGDLEGIVREMLPDGKYHDIRPILNGGGTRRAKFSAKWGRNGSSRLVRIKVDKKVEDPRSVETRARGYDTANDATILSHLPYDEAAAHGISPLLDYEEKDGVVVSVEPEFSGGKSAKEFFKDRSPTAQEFCQFILGTTRAVKYAHDQGFYHRDLNDENIMIRPNGKGLETRLTDWEYSVLRDRVRDAPFNTSGTRSLRDPLLETQPYGDQSEIYQIAMNALTLFTREPLDWNGDEKLNDPKERKESIKKAIAKLPKNIRKRHGKWIERGLTLDSGERFGSFGEFYTAVQKAVRPSLFERVKSNWRGIAATAIGTAALAGAGMWGYNTHRENVHLAELAEASIPRVKTQWNGRGMELSNDTIGFEVYLTGRQGNNKGSEFQWYPYNHKFLRMNAGDKIEFTSEASANIAREDSNTPAWLDLKGQFYIEGEKFDDGSVVKEFYVNTQNSDEAKRDYGQFGYYNPSRKEFTLPSDLKEGVYILAAEIYAPTEEERTKEYTYEGEYSKVVNSWHKARIRFENPGKAIARKRIPIVIGNPEETAEVYNIGFQWPSENWYARKLEDKMLPYGSTIANKKDITYLCAIPDLNFSRDLSQGSWTSLALPDPESVRQKGDLYFVMRDSKGEIIGYTGVPLAGKEVFDRAAVERGSIKQDYMWDFGEIDKGFAQQLVEYRESLPEKSEIHNE